MRGIKNKIDSAIIGAYIKGLKGKEKFVQILNAKNGEGFIDTAVFS